MLMRKDITPSDFEAWSGGKDTIQTIISKGKIDEFNDWCESLFSEGYPHGVNEEVFNDWLWFDRDNIFEALGVAE